MVAKRLQHIVGIVGVDDDLTMVEGMFVECVYEL